MHNNNGVRFLNMHDYKIVEDNFANCDRLWKLDLDQASKKKMLDYLPSHLNNNKQKYLLGFFQDNKLISILGMHFWPGRPFWSVTYLRCFKNEYKFNLKQTGIPLCFEFAAAFAETRGAYKFYYFWPERHSCLKPFKKHIIERHLEAGNRYFCSLEARIPANTQPQYNWQRNLMSEKTFPFPTSIISAAVKPEQLLLNHGLSQISAPDYSSIFC